MVAFEPGCDGHHLYDEEANGELQEAGGEVLDDCDEGLVADILGELVYFEHIDGHLIDLGKIELIEEVTAV
jgi:hypothetical protein